MPRSNWKGNISFGLVSIPIILFNSEDPSSDISFKMINRKTGDKIKYQRVDVDTGKEVPWEQIGKGYEYEKDVIIPVEEGELKKVAGENAHMIAIEEFVDKKNINLINVDKTYYIAPDKKGDKAYVILREALNSANKVGIAKVIISTREYLAAISTFENALVLHLMHYSDELRSISELNIPGEDLKKYKVSAKEVEIAKKLIQSMTAKWKPEKYKDEYKVAVQKWLNQKINHLPTTQMSKRGHAQKTNGEVISFVDLLKKSLEHTKTTKSEIPLKAKKPASPRQHARKSVTH